MKEYPWDMVFERKDSKLSYDDEFLLKYKIKCDNTKIIMKHRLDGEIITHTESPVIDWFHGEHFHLSIKTFLNMNVMFVLISQQKAKRKLCICYP